MGKVKRRTKLEKPFYSHLGAWIMRNKYNMLIMVTLVIICTVSYVLFGPNSSWTVNIVTGTIFLVLTIFFVNKLLERTRLERNVRSIRYVHSKVAGVFNKLIWGMRPPQDWKERLDEPDSKWDHFYDNIWNLRVNAINSLESLLERYYHLMDAKLRNDILDILTSLEDSMLMASPEIFRSIGKSHRLPDISADAVSIISQSIDLIKRHRLLDYSEVRSLSWSDGEVPKIKRHKMPNHEAHIQYRYELYEKFLKEAIEFRDQCGKLRLSKKSQ